jgi:hypothetical protein
LYESVCELWPYDYHLKLNAATRATTRVFAAVSGKAHMRMLIAVVTLSLLAIAAAAPRARSSLDLKILSFKTSFNFSGFFGLDVYGSLTLNTLYESV